MLGLFIPVEKMEEVRQLFEETFGPTTGEPVKEAEPPTEGKKKAKKAKKKE